MLADFSIASARTLYFTHPPLYQSEPPWPAFPRIFLFFFFLWEAWFPPKWVSLLTVFVEVWVSGYSTRLMGNRVWRACYSVDFCCKALIIVIYIHVHARKRIIFGLNLISRVIYHKDNFRRVFCVYLPIFCQVVILAYKYSNFA